MNRGHKIKRRDFLKTGVVAAGTVSLGATGLSRALGAVSHDLKTVRTALAETADGLYHPNRAPLAPVPFMKLPPGSISPRGWLKGQLDLQVNGLCGRYPEVSDYLRYDGNGWVDPASATGWEEVSYWLRGLTDLGYVTGDSGVTALAHKWITGILASQQPDGWFGPKGARASLDGDPDFWPQMPALYAIRSYAEVTDDPAVIPFLTRYFQLQSKQRPETFGKSWAGVRWGDNMDSIYWLYNRTGDAFLIDLVRKIHAHSADWTGGIASLHNVNFAQGFREPAQYGLIGGDPRFLAAAERNYGQMMAEFGQMAGGGFAGDENARHGYRDPRQGFETCGIVEYMLSFQILGRMTGSPLWMDRCEEIAFNMLPAAYDPEQKSLHYITSMNSVQLDNVAKTHGQFQNSFAMQAMMPGVHNYRCCPHNYGMGWPYYAENLWHATADRGLAANLYAASQVKARVGDGRMITITQETEYPFGDTVKMAIQSTEAVAFPLYLRIPRWCDEAVVRVNGHRLPAKPTPLSYLVINRTWKNGDTITLHLPMAVRVRQWTTNQNAVTVDRGPLTYSLAIAEKWDRYAGNDQWPEYSVYPQSAWNYGLALDPARPADAIEVVHKDGPVSANPFTHETAPIELRAPAKKIPNWKVDRENVITPLQPGPVRSTEPTETVRLIPMGAARLRLTSFPIIGGPGAREWVAPVMVNTSASHVFDSLDAMSDLSEPTSSDDQNTPRFTWWDHRGTNEWVAYDFGKPREVSKVSVYWFDDTGIGQCRIPRSWQLMYNDSGVWKPVEAAGPYATTLNTYNTVTFKPVTASAFRLEVQLQPGFSGGVLRWRMEGARGRQPLE